MSEMGIREELTALDKRYADEYQKATGNNPDNIGGSLIKKLKDGDLFRYLQKLYTGSTKSQDPSGIERRKWYKEHGYDPFAFICDRIGELDLEDRIYIQELKIGDILERRDICAIANDYNNRKGMYWVEEDGNKPFAICVSTPDNAKDYLDHWIEEGRSYYYNMQDEHGAGLGFYLKKKVNRNLYVDFENSKVTGHPSVCVYLFVHHPNLKKREFRFEGVYFVNDLPSDNAFEFVRDDVALSTPYLRKKREFLKESSKEKAAVLVGGREIKSLAPFDTSVHIQNEIKEYVEHLEFISREESEVDYVQKQRTAAKVGSMGEELVLKYEREYVRKTIPGKETEVKLAADSMGYDIRTFRLEKGRIKEIQLEVKTTAEDSPYTPFFMSDHEKRFMENHPDTYWLYRIYDVYSDEVRGVYLKGNVAEHLRLDPSDYECSFK